MVSRTGFVEMFWERAREDRKAGGDRSYEQIYQEMEDAFAADYGVRCFPTYDAFRKYRDRLSER